MADAGDLKSLAPIGACGFDSHPGHFNLWDLHAGSIRPTEARMQVQTGYGA